MKNATQVAFFVADIPPILHHTSPSTQPLPFCGHQKRVHMDMFLVFTGSPPLEKQKHAYGGMFLLFVGLSPPCQHQKRIHMNVFLMLAGSLLINCLLVPPLSLSPPPTCHSDRNPLS